VQAIGGGTGISGRPGLHPGVDARRRPALYRGEELRAICRWS